MGCSFASGAADLGLRRALRWFWPGFWGAKDPSGALISRRDVGAVVGGCHCFGPRLKGGLRLADVSRCEVAVVVGLGQLGVCCLRCGGVRGARAEPIFFLRPVKVLGFALVVGLPESQVFDGLGVQAYLAGRSQGALLEFFAVPADPVGIGVQAKDRLPLGGEMQGLFSVSLRCAAWFERDGVRGGAGCLCRALGRG